MVPDIAYFRAQAKHFLPPVWSSIKRKKEYSLKTTLSSARNIENVNIGTSGLVKEAFTDHYNLSR